jgi:F0F1-type ATP synthase membrane subunit c/vacuolar-type H+-ATPase subunit K
MDVNVAKLLAAGIALLPLFGVGLGLGKLFSSFIEAVGRNPGAKKDVFQIGMIGAAMTEAIGIFALVVALILIFVVKA